MVDLGTLGGGSSDAVAVNDRGQVVGSSPTGAIGPGGDPVVHAFSWTRTGGMVDLGVLPGCYTSIADAVNDRGEIVGYNETGLGGSTRLVAFSWTRGRGMVDLGALGGRGISRASAVNDRGQVVGESTTAGSDYNYDAFSWTRGGGMVDLGVDLEEGSVVGVNGRGQVLGDVTAPFGSHAELWTPVSR